MSPLQNPPVPTWYWEQVLQLPLQRSHQVQNQRQMRILRESFQVSLLQEQLRERLLAQHFEQ
jgi:hypothetical protein